jgi:TorA maturation chaperone TorD
VSDTERADCYRLLGACFCPPERERWLAEGTCLELAKALGPLAPDAAGHAAALHEALAAADALALRVDHAALFVGPFALKAAPYGSVYLEAGRTLLGDTTLDAAARYAAAGLRVVLREPPDHVAVELEFMQVLAARAATAAASGNHAAAAPLAEAQREFLAVHLGAWGEAFCEAVACEATTAFYRCLAACLRAFLEVEVRRAGAGSLA